jgi:hypothetical protein
MTLKLMFAVGVLISNIQIKFFSLIWLKKIKHIL